MVNRRSNSWCSVPRAGLAATLMLGLAAPAHAAVPAMFRVKRETVTPQRAAEHRTEVQAAANALKEIGDPVAAGVRLDEGAAQWGDPVLYMDAAEAYFAAAEQHSDTAFVDAGIERANIASDVLYFHLDSAADRNFRMAETGDLPGLIARADDLRDRGAALAERIEHGDGTGDEADVKPDKKKKKRKKGNADKALFISGAALTAVGGALMVMGVAGLGLGLARQNEAERPDVLGPDYDAVAARGRRANAMAGVGFGLGAAAAIAGVTLILVSKRRAKKKKTPDDDKLVRLSPSGGPAGGGLVLNGRF